MPLSEHEQNLLDQIERALYAEDPKFASTVRGARLRPSRRRRIQGISLFVLGVALLVCGMLVPLKVFDIPVVSVVGFLMMFLGAVLTLASLRQGNASQDKGTDERGGAAQNRSGFTQRMEERFRKRFEGE
jgi:protein-S-isoprenylcysteine O-methyltransferase Ste14